VRRVLVVAAFVAVGTTGGNDRDSDFAGADVSRAVHHQQGLASDGLADSDPALLGLATLVIVYLESEPVAEYRRGEKKLDAMLDQVGARLVWVPVVMPRRRRLATMRGRLAIRSRWTFDVCLAISTLSHPCLLSSMALTHWRESR
jgi:hypothetical protein